MMPVFQDKTRNYHYICKQEHYQPFCRGANLLAAIAYYRCGNAISIKSLIYVDHRQRENEFFLVRFIRFELLIWDVNLLRTKGIFLFVQSQRNNKIITIMYKFSK